MFWPVAMESLDQKMAERPGEWLRMAGKDFLKIAIDPENGDNIYGTSVWGFHLSRDGGESWTSANKG